MDIAELRFEVFSCYREVHHLQRRIDALLVRAAKAADSADRLDNADLHKPDGSWTEPGRYQQHNRASG